MFFNFGFLDESDEEMTIICEKLEETKRKRKWVSEFKSKLWRRSCD